MAMAGEGRARIGIKRVRKTALSARTTSGTSTPAFKLWRPVFREGRHGKQDMTGMPSSKHARQRQQQVEVRRSTTRHEATGRGAAAFEHEHG